MAATECRDITEWVEEQVSKPVEEWEERQEQRCKEEDCNWWTLCLNKLFCWFVTVLVKVVRWVVVTVGKWVTRTVCTVVSVLVDLVVAVVTGLVDIVVGIATWDWGRVWDGFVEIVGGVVKGVLGLVRVVLLVDTIDFIREEIQKQQLRDHVRGLLEKRFARDPESLSAAREAIGVDHGAFGLRLTGRLTRTFVSSDRTTAEDGVPDLIRWHEDPDLDIDIRKLAGYDHDSFWRRGRPEVSGADEGQVDRYIADRGGRSFRIFPMSESVLRHKASVCEERARELGLIYEFEYDEREVTDPAYVRLAESEQDEYDVDVLHRIDENVDSSGARNLDLPVPHGGTVFGYAGTLVGLSAHLDDAVGVDGSPFPGSNTSGVSCLDRVPDLVFEYVLAHELGHYFGLVHVDGAHRIMFTMNKSQGKSVFTWWTVPSLLLVEQQPKFVLEEAKRAWDYIVAGWPTKALTTRAHG
ncbi:MAG: hypothetical protein HOQ22_11865 [Nocardioidaceae bacterium]|nr:hypothetical protein [Nocardioidaceae bacterium]NUS51719.1 hypothetical protein [Nocardioidaceae bacterium]